MTNMKNTLKDTVNEITVRIDSNGNLTVTVDGESKTTVTEPLAAKALDYFSNRGHDGSQNRKFSKEEMSRPLEWFKLNVQEYDDDSDLFVEIRGMMKGGYFRERREAIPSNMPEQIKKAIEDYVKPRMMKEVWKKGGN